MKIIVATSRPWNEFISEKVKAACKCEVLLINQKEDLNLETISAFKPDYIFFPHWSYIIKEEIFNQFPTVIFHMTDLPYGRGGSPLQNLIVRGIENTMISAIKCTEVLDGGDIYLKKPLSLVGSAQEIFNRASLIICEMIIDIVTNRPVPYAQVGEPVAFVRRKPEDSNIAPLNNLKSIYDQIRMVDADGYPRAFIKNENVVYEFSNAKFENDEIIATVKIKRTI